MAEEKEPFVSSEQRPNVGLHPDTPIAELRVRDLQALLNSGAQFKRPLENFGNWKFVKIEKLEKHEIIELIDLSRIKFKEKEGDPPPELVGDPAKLDKVIQEISGLSEKVTQLTRDVQQLQNRSGGR